MTLLLDAIERAGNEADERDRVVEETLATTDFASALGTFSIDDNGDTSLDRARRVPGPRRAPGVRDVAARAAGAAGLLPERAG